MSFVLRDYQQKASDAAVTYFKSKTVKNAIMVLPTGSGKSLILFVNIVGILTKEIYNNSF